MKKRKFKAKKTTYGLDDFGVASGTFKVEQTIKDKIYEEHYKFVDGPYGKEVPSGFVIDDNSCWNEIGSKSFNELFEEIK
jgi:hypothetical protein